MVSTPSGAVEGDTAATGMDPRLGPPGFRSLDPRTGERGGDLFHDSTSLEIESAARAAATASPVLAARSLAELSALLAAVADALEAETAALVATADAETALGRPALEREMRRTTWQFRAFGAVVSAGWHLQAIIDLPDAEFIPLPRPDLRRMLVPIGPVAVFAASNVPFAFGVCGGDTASALAAGCPVVVKGHPSQPATGRLLGRVISDALRDAGAPDGAFSLVQGGERVSTTLVSHPAIRAVGFTGSLRGGRALFDVAAQRPDPIPVYAEMGSVNPTFVTAAALEARAEGIGSGFAESLTVGNGQFCTKPGILVVPGAPSLGRLHDALRERLSAIAVDSLLNERIYEQFCSDATVLEALAGVEPFVEGGLGSGALAVRPRVLMTRTPAFLAHAVLREEHFGPLGIVVTYADHAELADLVAALPNALSAAIHAEPSDVPELAGLVRSLVDKVGRIAYNAFPTGVSVTHAMQHGGPYPATTAPWSTSVGSTAVFRFLRPVAFQGFPAALLPPALADANPLGLWRLVNGAPTTDPVPAP